MSKYEEMSDAQIDYLVKGARYGHNDKDINRLFHGGRMSFCSNPKDAWPIIVENKINTYPESESDNEIGMATFTGNWGAVCFDSDGGEFAVDCQYFEATSDNPLRAAMIVFLMMKEGE